MIETNKLVVGLTSPTFRIGITAACAMVVVSSVVKPFPSFAILKRFLFYDEVQRMSNLVLNIVRMSTEEETKQICSLITRNVAPHYVLDKRQFRSLFDYMSDKESHFMKGGRGGGRFITGFRIDKSILLQQWVNQNRPNLVPVNCNPLLFEFSLDEFISWWRNVISILNNEVLVVDTNTIDLIALYLGFNRKCKFCTDNFSSQVDRITFGQSQGYDTAQTDQYYKYKSSIALLFWQCSLSASEESCYTCQACKISYVHHLTRINPDFSFYTPLPPTSRISFVSSLPCNSPFIMSVGTMNGFYQEIPLSEMKVETDPTSMYCPFSICRCCSFPRIPIPPESSYITFTWENLKDVTCDRCPHCNQFPKITYRCEHSRADSNRTFKYSV